MASKKTALSVEHVSMKFNLSSQKVDNIKEYVIKMLKKELMYQEFWALKDVNFEIKRGDRVGIMGLNGAGKSTLLKVIAGVLKPTEGTVKCNGKIVPLLELGAGFDKQYTGAENIYLYGAVLGYSKEFIDKKYKDIVVFDADLAGATKTINFAKKFPERFFDMGIAESNMMSTAAGMATTGKVPFASTFAVFATGRSYDQIRNSICYPNLNVKICGTHYGITVGEDGATHQMLEDISLMRTLPNMKVLSPSDDTETKWAIEEAYKQNGPVYVRLSRMATPIIYDENQKFEFGKMIQIGDGKDATIFATGDVLPEALKAKTILEEKEIFVRVIDVHTIKPIDEDMIIKCAKETKRLISIEDHNIIGGLGSAISEVLTNKFPAKLERMGMNDEFGRSGKAEELMKFYGVNFEKIVDKILKLC